MNIAVIGLGSMGKRRIRLLKQINEDVNIIGVDGNKSRSDEVQKNMGILCLNDVEHLKDHNCQAALICASPLAHGNLINACLKKGMHIFSELNLVSDMYEENIELARLNNLKLFLSSTRLYRKEIQKIEEEVKGAGCEAGYMYHVGQYLPDWHPWESYKDFFVSNPRTNGCREIMAIEFPWLSKVFGKIKNFHVLAKKMSSLDIDNPDCFFIQLEHDSGCIGSFCVDLISREAQRKLDIFGENIHIVWDGKPDNVHKLDISSKKMIKLPVYDNVSQDNNYSSLIIEDAYKDELLDFFAYINGSSTPKYNFKYDQEILSLIDKIEGK